MLARSNETDTVNRSAPVPAERARNSTDRIGPIQPDEIESSIVARFGAIATQYADRIAVKTAGWALSYAALGRMSDGIADELIERRGRTVEPVLLLLSDDLWMLAALFGVLKSGRFYVPLDPAQASDRDRYILSDCRARLIITSVEHLPRARELSDASAQIILIDEIDLTRPRQLPPIYIPPLSLAFITYTSGSTGEPKGVMQTHRGLLASVMRGTQVLRTSSDDRITLLSAFTAGAAPSDIFGALLNGACLYPIRVNRDGIAYLASCLTEGGITLYHSVPSVFRYLAASLTQKIDAPTLRVIKLAGEAVQPADVDLYKRYFPDGSLLHVSYGSTEINTLRQFPVDKNTEISGGHVPVGFANQQVDIAIVDSEGDPLPPGSPGDILIRSDHLSPGYWGKPDLTAASFVPDPESRGGRAYLPGDVGRLSPDGCLFHLGRRDFLVKIRGSGVDINELERTLLQIDGVNQATVIVNTASDGENALTAFASQGTGAVLSDRYLRAEIARRLPNFMAPARFVIRDQLPQSSAGKIDRQALKVLAVTAAPNNRQAARNDTDARLVSQWRQALGLDQVGIDDNFFELGGHSLIAAKMVSNVNADYGTDFRPSLLIEAPTIRQMADRLSHPTDHRPQSVIAINRAGTRPPFFCVHGVGGEVLAFRLLSNHLGPDQPFFALAALPGATDLAIEDIARRYIEEIESISPAGPYRLGGYSFGGIIAFEMAQQLVARGRTVEFLAMIDAYAPGYPKPLAISQRVRINLAELGRNRNGDRWSFVKDRLRVNFVSARRSVRGMTRRVPKASSMLSPEAELEQKLYAGRAVKRQYSPAPYSFRIDVFRATDLRPTFQRDDSLGWSPLAAGGLVTHEIPGDHFTILAEPNVARLAQALGLCLQEA